ncbi:MAG: type IV pilin protein [Candidatus Omnitrophota bacterium]
MERGFSILELMIVVVIVVIVTTFAVPSYAKYIERSRGKSAQANLTLIHNMEKRYKLDNGAYYECATSPAGCSLAVINAELGLFIRDSYFNYNIAINGLSGYKVTATRLASGACSGNTMTVTDASSEITKECLAW